MKLDKTIHEQFELRVQETPDALAVTFEDQKITYDQLNQKANQLARYLQHLGVKTETLVALSMDRSIEMMVAILAILKAGGAYVPLDPTYPQDRLEFMLEDAQAPVLITDSSLKDKFPAYKGRVVLIDQDWDKIELEGQENLGRTSLPANLIYVIYTSGSTGKPKGVLITHAGVSNYLNWSREAFSLTGKDIVDFSSSFSFDASVYKTLLPLTTGSQIATCSEEQKKDPKSYFEYLLQCKATIIGGTSSHLAQLNAFKSEFELPHLRIVVMGGEPLVPAEAASWLSHFPTQKIINEYGPTEITVATTWFVVDKNNINKFTSSIPIGKPIPHSKLYILDPQMQQVAEGELYIGGRGVARGYLNRPELTQQRFIPNPFADEHDKENLRLYKTGDLVRLLPDGNLDFLGRIDDQVKIRGFRIELGEIEYVLRQDSRISNCVVIAREDRPGEKRLAAYLVSREGMPTEQQAVDFIASLRERINSQLPDYMMPSAFVFLKELPLNPNKKIDRKALPAPEHYYRSSDYVAPRNAWEEKLASLWSQLLKIQPISVTDDFFLLGGHSLLVMKLLASIKQEFNIELPFRSIFDCPTIEKLALLLKKEPPLPTIPLSPQRRTKPIALSFAQQRLWFLDQIISDKSIYNIPFAMRLIGNLDQAALTKAFRDLIDRHETLRTRFTVVEGLPEQVIEGKVDFSIEQTNDNKNLELIYQAEARKPFNLGHAPLMRARLITLGKTEHVLLVVLHHAISDEWSMDIFMHELSAYYNHYAFNQPLDLPKLPIQYADYALWQRKWLQGEVLEKQLRYWNSHLSGAPEALDFPFDKPRPLISTYQGNTHQILLSKKSLQSLKSLGTHHQSTLFMVLLAALQVLLHRYSGQDDIVVGSPIAHRNHKEVEGLIGFFVNMIALRAHLGHNPRFLDVLKQIREISLQAYAHQDVPFEQLVEHLNVTRHLGRNPIFQVVLALQTAESTGLHLLGLQSQPYKINTGQALFDLTFTAKELRSGEMAINIDYSTDLFEAATIERLSQHFMNLLEEIVRHPETPIEEIKFLTSSEYEQALITWNQTETASPRDKTLHELFEIQVKKTPHAIAVIYEDQKISYQELNEKADQLAHHLKGIQVETLIAISLDRSIEMIIGLLAILKAGGAYVPLDPSYPQDRLTFILEDTQAPILITHSLLSKKFQGYKGRVLEIDKLKKLEKDNVVSISKPSNLAYVIYTSGSTGKPKGVLIEHASICDRIEWCQSFCHLSSQDRFLHLFSFSFDGAVLSCWWPLISGVMLVIPSLEGISDPDYLIGLLKKHQITTLFSTPSLLQLIFNNPYPHHLSHVIAGGEKLTKELLAKMKAVVPHVYNFYGPTECTVVAIASNTEDQKIEEDPVIGHPIANTTAYILNSALQPGPCGSRGEIYLGGKNLARGYLNRHALTTERFIQDPFDRRPHARLYKTGDLASQSADGNITYLGRIDQQVKVRGYRIELGEIESILREDPQIKECVVLAQESSSAGTRLIAYVVLNDKHENHVLITQALRQLLHRQLPEYMVPSAFIFLEELPLTPNGKIDAQRLLQIKVDYSSERYSTAPLTETEKTIAALCCTLLGLEKVNIHDNFFLIGGHSLLATQLIALLRKNYHVDIPLRLLFENPILTDLAREIDKIGVSKEKPPELPPLSIDRNNRNEPFPLTDIQQAYLIGRSGLFELSKVAAHSYKEFDYPNLDIKRLEDAWNILVQRHEALRLIFLNESQQHILPTVPHYSIAVTDLSDQPAEKIESYLQEIREKLSHEILPAHEWPLFDIRATKLPDRIRLHLSFDGLIMDAWSYFLLFAEWIELYKDPAAALPPLELSFRDYVLFQKAIENTSLYARDKKYWLDRLPTFPEAPSLPLSKNPELLSHQMFSRLTFNLPQNKWKNLQHQIREKQLSPAGVLTALLAEVLAKWSSTAHFALNLTLFNRLPVHPQVNSIMGDFTSLLLLEVDHRKSKNFLTRAKDLQAQLWKDLDHQSFSGIQFIRALAHQRKKEGSAIMPIVFTCVLHESSQEEKFTDEAKAVFAITQTPQLWLDCKAYERDGGLVLEWDYLAELFPAGLIEAMHTACCQLTEKIADDHSLWNQTSFDLLPPDQMARRAEINDTNWKTKTALLHELFHSQAALHPQNPAVFSSRGDLTYQQLQNYSNQLGHRLRELKVQPNQLVAIVMEKGWEQVVACLGILNAGAAYLPLDPELPGARLESILDRAEVSIILTQTEHLDKLPKKFYSICIDKIAELLKNYSKAHLAPIQSMDDLAYVIFTSGTTGQPKGGMIDHQGVVNTILDINDRFQVKSTDRVFAISNLNFDLSVYDIFGLLAAGGAIILPPSIAAKDPQVWIEWMSRDKATIWNSVPMLMQMLLEVSGKHPPLRLVLLSGDAIPLTLPEKIYQTFGEGSLKVISLGGATEASIWSIDYPIHQIEKEWKTIPYGKPLRNQQYYVLNENLEMCPDWVAGNLYIGGMGLAKGYWKDRDKTESSFIFHPQLQKRLYKTGDLGCYFPDGNIEFLGRSDFQVKISGHRIELSEIEYHLLQVPFVSQAVVDVFKDLQNNKHLAAYVVFKKSDLVKDPGNIIKDEASRLSFKLAQHGIENFPASYPEIPLKFHDSELEERIFSRKSYRTYQSKTIALEAFEKLLQESFAKIKSNRPKIESAGSLGRLLHELRAFPYSEAKLLKYQYGSAGGLYPVQTYVEIGPTHPTGTPSGIYYYHPSKHQLIKIGATRLHSPTTKIYFVAKQDAIAPMYGALSNDFCWLEAGYMTSVLASACQELKIGLEKTIAPENSRFHPCSHLKGEYHLLVTLQFSEKERPSNSTDILIYIKKGRIEGLEGGWYTYDSGLHLISKDTRLDSIYSVGEMGSAFAEAAFYIYFLSSKDRLESLIQAGFYTQNLMDNGAKYFIGFCPIGNLDTDTFNSLAHWTHGKEVLHTLIGGRISQEQIISKEISNPKTDDFFHTYLSENLRRNLPEYMVPPYFVFLDTFPLSPNGKVDRKALPSPSHLELIDQHIKISPRNYIELALESLWKECLQLPSVSINDNFFEIGGNSLLVIRLVNQINKNKSFNVTLTISDFINAPTIAGLAHLLATKATGGPVYSLLTIQSEGPNIPLFLIHPAAGLALPYLPLASYFRQQPIYGIRNPKFGQFEDVFTSVEEMASNYIQQIQTIQPEGPYQLGGWSFGGIIALEMAQQLIAQGHSIKLVLLIDSYYADPDYFKTETAPASESLQTLMQTYGVSLDSEEGKAIAFEVNHTSQLLAKYHPHSYDGRVVLLKAKEGTDTRFLNTKQKKVQEALAADRLNGWKKFLPQIESIVVEGEHDLLFSPAYIAGVASQIQHALSERKKSRKKGTS